MLLKVRKKIKLKQIFDYPKNLSQEELELFIFKKLDKEKINVALEKIANFLIEKKLSYNWMFPILVAILTNTLLIPPKNNIKLYVPDFFSSNEEKKLNDVRTVDDLKKSIIFKSERFIEKKTLLNSPAIYFQNFVSINDIIKWIRKNKLFIKTAINALFPKRRDIKIYKSTLTWGLVAHLLKEDGIKGWSKMAKYLNNWFNDRISSEFRPIPDERELRKCYFRFLEQIEKISSK